MRFVHVSRSLFILTAVRYSAAYICQHLVIFTPGLSNFFFFATANTLYISSYPCWVRHGMISLILSPKNGIRIHFPGTEVIAQGSRALVALPQDLRSLPSTHVVVHDSR